MATGEVDAVRGPLGCRFATGGASHDRAPGPRTSGAPAITLGDRRRAAMGIGDPGSWMPPGRAVIDIGSVASSCELGEKPAHARDLAQALTRYQPMPRPTIRRAGTSTCGGPLHARWNAHGSAASHGRSATTQRPESVGPDRFDHLQYVQRLDPEQRLMTSGRTRERANPALAHQRTHDLRHDPGSRPQCVRQIGALQPLRRAVQNHQRPYCEVRSLRDLQAHAATILHGREGPKETVPRIEPAAGPAESSPRAPLMPPALRSLGSSATMTAVHGIRGTPDKEPTSSRRIGQRLPRARTGNPPVP